MENAIGLKSKRAIFFNLAIAHEVFFVCKFCIVLSLRIAPPTAHKQACEGGQSE